MNNACYLDTPVAVYSSCDRCDTKRIKRCDPLYGTVGGALIVAFAGNPSQIDYFLRVDKLYWLIASNKYGKISDCQVKAISLIFSALLVGGSRNPSLQQQLMYIADFYTSPIIYQFGDSTNSDDCKAILSAIGYTVAGLIIGVARNISVIDGQIQYARLSIARAIAASPCCCKKDFMTAVLGDPNPTIVAGFREPRILKNNLFSDVIGINAAHPSANVAHVSPGPGPDDLAGKSSFEADSDVRGIADNDGSLLLFAQ